MHVGITSFTKQLGGNTVLPKIKLIVSHGRKILKAKPNSMPSVSRTCRRMIKQQWTYL